MTADVWRYTCPEGHHSWRPLSGPGYYCHQCLEHFDHLHDKKTGGIKEPQRVRA